MLWVMLSLIIRSAKPDSIRCIFKTKLKLFFYFYLVFLSELHERKLLQDFYLHLSFIYEQPELLLLLCYYLPFKPLYEIFCDTIVCLLFWPAKPPQGVSIFFTLILFYDCPYIFFPTNRYGNIISTKAILDKNTNKCKGKCIKLLFILVGCR